MVPEAIDSWQSRPCGKCSDPFSLVEEHSVDLHDDCLNAVISECMKCGVEIIRRADFNGN
jgi:RNase P subunit RPR2